eukprot:Pompholyxophrys_punicea_v1_NODE_512_length_1796_cov_6.566341.p4 type:complete len:106 gc:universal NODE_512_length_1796_cov_6.566341:671-354(-)
MYIVEVEIGGDLLNWKRHVDQMRARVSTRSTNLELDQPPRPQEVAAPARPTPIITNPLPVDVTLPEMAAAEPIIGATLEPEVAVTHEETVVLPATRIPGNVEAST